MSAEKVFIITSETAYYGTIAIAIILAMIFLIVLVYILVTPNRNNIRLIVLVIVIILDNVAYSWSLLEFLKYNEDLAFIIFGIAESFDTLAHWLISEIYLKLALEVTFLLNKSIY